MELLFDKDSFVEIGNMIESRIEDFDLKSKRVMGDGVVTGYGEVEGRLTFAYAEDFTVMGGTLGEYHSLKICHLQDMAYNMKAPIIMINDSGGARIEEGISSLSGYSGIFYRNTKASGVIPQIAVILGPCSGGACYSPAICDFILIVRNIGKMFITGPQVVKTVIGEEVSLEELGGASVHEIKSGVTHFTYEDEEQCLLGVKKLLSYLPSSYEEKPTVFMNRNSENQEIKKGASMLLGKVFGKFTPHVQESINEKQLDRSSELIKIVPDNSKKPYDVKSVIECVTDNDSFFEVQSGFAKNAVIGFARMEGAVIGIVANQPLYMAGSLDCDAADKIARFIRTCDCFNIPLITLVDVPAFYPGINQEHKGIIRHGAKILYAYSEATVPKISLIMRKAYGGAYIAMNSMNMGADIVYAWPIAEIAVMGAEGATNIAFKKQIAEAPDPKALKDRLATEYTEKFMNPYVAAARGFITEVIKPQETRESLLSALKVLKNKSMERPNKKHGNMPL